MGLALDAYLLFKRNDRLISDVIRTKTGKACLIVFCLHIGNLLGRVDPFSLAGALIAARLAEAVPPLSDVLPISK
jgi:hypothetical protein